MKNTTSNHMGRLTGKLVAATKSLPEKTAQAGKSVKNTGASLKDEFVAGFKETNGSNKG